MVTMSTTTCRHIDDDGGDDDSTNMALKRINKFESRADFGSITDDMYKMYKRKEKKEKQDEKKEKKIRGREKKELMIGIGKCECCLEENVLKTCTFATSKFFQTFLKIFNFH